jgi:hypothetical protein
MADASRPPPSPPPGWGELFSALPQEAPPASRWPQIEARLDARHRAHTRARRRNWLALAAGLSVLVLAPMVWTLRDASLPADTGTPAVAPVASVDPTAPHTPPVVATTTTTAKPQPIVARASRSTAAADRIVTRPWPKATVSDDTLGALHTASAQLEGLLALTRDTRVESGPAAALAGAYDAELATIDAQLAQTGLSEAEQLSLWRARVDTLRQSAEFESQLRLLAADGRRLEGALVSID